MAKAETEASEQPETDKTPGKKTASKKKPKTAAEKRPKKVAGKRAAAKKAGKAAKGEMTRADFVRTQPEDMPAQEVVDRAKAAGITMTRNNVYMTRRQDAEKAAGKKTAGTAKKTKRKTSGKSRTSTGTKASATPKRRGKAPEKRDRVLAVKREHSDWTAAQIVEALKPMKCSTNHVYKVLRDAGLSGRKAAKKAALTTTATAVAPQKTATTLDVDIEFGHVVKKIGLEKAKAMIAFLEAYGAK